MNAIVAGKQEKQAGSLVFKSVVHVEPTSQDYRLVAQTDDSTAVYFKFETIDGKIWIGNINNMGTYSDSGSYSVSFPAGSFAGIGRVYLGHRLNPNQFEIQDYNYQTNSVVNAFKYLELGTLE